MKIKKPGLSLIVCLLAVIMVLTSVPLRADAASSSEIKKQINTLKEQKAAIQKEYNEIRSQYKANENEMLDMVEQKNLIDQEITLLHNQILNINDQIAAYALLIADKQDELDDATKRLADLNEKHKERIRAMEEEGEISYWEVLFKANDFSDLLDRLNMIQEISAADQRRLKEIADTAEEVRVAKAALAEEKKGLEETKVELDAAQQVLEEKRAEADAILTELISKRLAFLGSFADGEGFIRRYRGVIVYGFVDNSARAQEVFDGII